MEECRDRHHLNAFSLLGNLADIDDLWEIVGSHIIPESSIDVDPVWIRNAGGGDGGDVSKFYLERHRRDANACCMEGVFSEGFFYASKPPTNFIELDNDRRPINIPMLDTAVGNDPDQTSPGSIIRRLALLTTHGRRFASDPDGNVYIVGYEDDMELEEELEDGQFSVAHTLPSVDRILSGWASQLYEVPSGKVFNDRRAIKFGVPLSKTVSFKGKPQIYCQLPLFCRIDPYNNGLSMRFLWIGIIPHAWIATEETNKKEPGEERRIPLAYNRRTLSQFTTMPNLTFNILVAVMNFMFETNRHDISTSDAISQFRSMTPDQQQAFSHLNKARFAPIGDGRRIWLKRKPATPSTEVLKFNKMLNDIWGSSSSSSSEGEED
mgnify:CR=1 FL=1